MVLLVHLSLRSSVSRYELNILRLQWNVKQMLNAMAENRTRVNCLEGNYANHYTTIPHVQSIHHFSGAAQVGMSKTLHCWVGEYDGTSKFKPLGYRCIDNLINHVDMSGVGFEPTPSLKTRILLLLLLKQGVYPWVWRLRPLGHPDDGNPVLINKNSGRVLLISPRNSFPSILAIKIR